jgi:hypothetical protein
VQHPPWDEGVVQGVADVLGESGTGLTGGEIGKLLASLGIDDPGPGITKRDRLGEALRAARSEGVEPRDRFHPAGDGTGPLPRES